MKRTPNEPFGLKLLRTHGVYKGGCWRKKILISRSAEEATSHNEQQQLQHKPNMNDEEHTFKMPYPPGPRGVLQSGAGGAICGAIQGAVAGDVIGGDERAGGAIGGAIQGAAAGGVTEGDERADEIVFFEEVTKGEPFSLTSEQETEIVEWLFENPIFYKRSNIHILAKLKDKKKQLMKAQAKKMNIRYDGMYRWCKSMAQQNAMMVSQDKKSELSRLGRSERDMWILDNFSFWNDPDTLG